jgi:hypothetical protein
MESVCHFWSGFVGTRRMNHDNCSLYQIGTLQSDSGTSWMASKRSASSRNDGLSLEYQSVPTCLSFGFPNGRCLSLRMSLHSFILIEGRIFPRRVPKANAHKYLRSINISGKAPIHFPSGGNVFFSVLRRERCAINFPRSSFDSCDPRFSISTVTLI